MNNFSSLMINMSFIYLLFFLCNCTCMLNKTCLCLCLCQKLKMLQMLMAIFVAYSTSGVTSDKKISSRAQNGGHFENVKILNTASIWHQKWKDHPKLCKKKYFHSADVIDDVTEWPQSGFSIFLYEWNNNVFHENWRTNKDIIFKLSVLMIIELWIRLYKRSWSASLMTSYSPKIGQNFEMQ